MELIQMFLVYCYHVARWDICIAQFVIRTNVEKHQISLRIRLHKNRKSYVTNYLNQGNARRTNYVSQTQQNRNKPPHLGTGKHHKDLCVGYSNKRLKYPYHSIRINNLDLHKEEKPYQYNKYPWHQIRNKTIPR